MKTFFLLILFLPSMAFCEILSNSCFLGSKLPAFPVAASCSWERSINSGFVADSFFSLGSFPVNSFCTPAQIAVCIDNPGALYPVDCDNTGCAQYFCDPSGCVYSDYQSYYNVNNSGYDSSYIMSFYCPVAMAFECQSWFNNLSEPFYFGGSTETLGIGYCFVNGVGGSVSADSFGTVGYYSGQYFLIPEYYKTDLRACCTNIFAR